MKFSQAEAESWVNQSVELVRPFRNLPQGALGMVKRLVQENGRYLLAIEFRHQNSSGSNRHNVQMSKRQFSRFTQRSDRQMSEMVPVLMG